MAKRKAKKKRRKSRKGKLPPGLAAYMKKKRAKKRGTKKRRVKKRRKVARKSPARRRKTRVMRRKKSYGTCTIRRGRKRQTLTIHDVAEARRVKKLLS